MAKYVQHDEDNSDAVDSTDSSILDPDMKTESPFDTTEADSEILLTPSVSDERTGLFKGTKSYKRRWYILALWCAVGFANFEIWNTWGPIQNTAKYTFNWKTSQISLLVNLGLFTLILFPPVFVLIIDRYGLRVAQLITAGSIAAGASIRLIIPDNSIGICIIQDLGEFLNGIGGVLPMAASTMLSLKWFPEGERRTATAFSTGTQQIGLALSFLIGPLLVDDLKPVDMANSSTDPNDTSTVEPGPTKEEMQGQIWHYILYQSIYAVVLFVLVVVYFPRSPPKPPSEVSFSKREDLLPSVGKIVKKPKFWCLAFVYGLFSGVFNSYLSILDVDLQPKGFSQVLAGWIGSTTTLAGAIGGVIFANLADRLRRHNPVKKLLLMLLCVGFGSFLLFVLSVKAFSLSLAANKAVVFVTVVVTGICSASSVPLVFEMGSDILFPISEELIGSMLVLVQNVFGSLILAAMSIPQLGDAWLDYAVLSGVLLAIPLVLVVDDTNERGKMSETVRRQSGRSIVNSRGGTRNDYSDNDTSDDNLIIMSH